MGPYVYLWPIHVDVWWKPSQYCKVIILQKKIEEKAFDKNDNFKSVFKFECIRSSYRYNKA